MFIQQENEMINVWILTMLVIGYNNAPTSYQLKFDSVQKCTSYSKYITSQYDGINNIVVAKGICIQTQEQKN